MNDVLVICVFAAGQWEILKSTATAGTAVVGIMNPNSGPGIATDPGYMAAIADVQTSGAQIHVHGIRVGGGWDGSVASKNGFLAPINPFV